MCAITSAAEMAVSMTKRNWVFTRAFGYLLRKTAQSRILMEHADEWRSQLDRGRSTQLGAREGATLRLFSFLKDAPPRNVFKNGLFPKSAFSMHYFNVINRYRRLKGEPAAATANPVCCTNLHRPTPPLTPLLLFLGLLFLRLFLLYCSLPLPLSFLPYRAWAWVYTELRIV